MQVSQASPHPDVSGEFSPHPPHTQNNSVSTHLTYPYSHSLNTRKAVLAILDTMLDHTHILQLATHPKALQVIWPDAIQAVCNALVAGRLLPWVLGFLSRVR